MNLNLQCTCNLWQSSNESYTYMYMYALSPHKKTEICVLYMQYMYMYVYNIIPIYRIKYCSKNLLDVRLVMARNTLINYSEKTWNFRENVKCTHVHVLQIWNGLPQLWSITNNWMHSTSLNAFSLFSPVHIGNIIFYPEPLYGFIFSENSEKISSH